MADITKCANEHCPSKEQCYRYTAPDGVWQSFSFFKPDETGKCKYFSANDKGDVLSS
jgi:hypothetical protein